MHTRPPEPSDVTAGRRARATALDPDAERPSTDPTAGRRARDLAQRPDGPQPILDPTDPHCEDAFTAPAGS